MIISGLAMPASPPGAPPPTPEAARPSSGGMFYTRSYKTRSKQRVTEDSAKRVATAYRCANTICDDLGLMPLQQFNSFQGTVTRLYPNATTRNLAYLLEIQSNRWMVPFLWKRTVGNWLIWWGNCYVWSPPSKFPELFILDSSKVTPQFDDDGNKWYQVRFANGQVEFLPDVEVAHLMINSKDGVMGLSVLEHARETIGRQLAAHQTQDSIAGDGLKPTVALYLKSKQLSDAAKEVVRKSYLESAGTGAAIFETDVVDKYDTITMKPTDAQFLEGIAATDADIANFFNFPLHKLNMGKQSYESNEQQELDYQHSCLDPFCVQIEQVGRLKWIAEKDQPFQYIRFNRDALLRTDPKTRTAILIDKVRGGILTPNQALQIDDQNGFAGGDAHYMQTSYGRILADGSVEVKGGTPNPQPLP